MTDSMMAYYSQYKMYTQFKSEQLKITVYY